MKIAINASPMNGAVNTGVLVYTKNLLYGLAKLDSNNEYSLLFTSLRRKPSEMPGPLKHNFKKEILRLPNIKFPFRNILLNNFILSHFLGANKCDIYHALVGFYLPRIKTVKKIITIHDLRTLKISDKNYPQDIRALSNSIQSIDTCITVSETTKRDIIEHFPIVADKIKVIYLGVDERFGQKANQETILSIKKRYGILKKYFFSVGAVPRKNVSRLIQAFALMKYKNDFQLVIGGCGSNGPWFAAYCQMIEKLRLSESVKLIGYIPDQDLPHLYKGSDTFVFPSLYEGFGIPILEAMKSGTPVITSNVSSLPEIGGNAVLYVDPYNVEDIAKAMERIIEDEELKQSLIDKGLKRAGKFSWEKMAKETLQVYLEVAKN